MSDANQTLGLWEETLKVSTFLNVSPTALKWAHQVELSIRGAILTHTYTKRIDFKKYYL